MRRDDPVGLLGCRSACHPDRIARKPRREMTSRTSIHSSLARPDTIFIAARIEDLLGNRGTAHAADAIGVFPRFAAFHKPGELGQPQAHAMPMFMKVVQETPGHGNLRGGRKGLWCLLIWPPRSVPQPRASSWHTVHGRREWESRPASAGIRQPFTLAAGVGVPLQSGFSWCILGGNAADDPRTPTP